MHYAVGRPRYERDGRGDAVKSTEGRELEYTDYLVTSHRFPRALRAEPSEQMQIIQLLLDHGVDPEAVEREGLSPLVAPCLKQDYGFMVSRYMTENAVDVGEWWRAREEEASLR